MDRAESSGIPLLVCYNNLIRRGTGKWCGGKAYTMTCRVKYGIEAFKECITIDEVKALPRRSSDICDDEVYIAASASNKSIEGTGPKLGVRSKLVGYAVDMEEQTFQVCILRAGDPQKSRLSVKNSPGGGNIAMVGIRGNEKQSGSGIYDAGRRC